MTGSFLRGRRSRVVAGLAAVAAVGTAIATIANGPVGAAPGGDLATSIRAKTELPKGLHGAPPAWTRTGRAVAGEPGGSSLPVGVPRKGSYGFLLALNSQSTMSAYGAALGRGKAAAATAAKAQYQQVRADQARVVTALPAAAPGSRVLYRSHSVLAGVAVYTDVRNYDALRRLAGVQAVYPITPKTLSNSYAVPLVHAPQAWVAHSDLGQNSTVAVIDTGIDFTHANFGGTGTAAAYTAALAADTALPASGFPSTKILGGYDFVGDAYDASVAGSDIPVPDPNPLDCNEHGSHVSGTVAGYGENPDGTTYVGPYNTSTPFDTLRIGPGIAPQAKLYAYKVFGCNGSTNVVGAAIDRAADPNGDGDPSDHVDVINMSLGADFGSPQDADAVASNAASDRGITVVVASGNGGDFYDVGGSPGDASKVIAVANGVDAYNQIDTLKVTAPAAVSYGAERSVAYAWATKADLAGNLVALTDSTNKDGCTALNAGDATAVNGKVAFLEWTDDSTVRRCGSATRSGNAAAAGAIGFVLADDAETFASGITGSATIPGVMVIKSAGDAIRTQLAAATTVTVGGTEAATFRQVVPGNDDTVNDSSSRGIRGAGNVKPDVTAIGTSVFSTAMGTGNQGVAFTGTSMATPMVAGLAALVRTKHPDWTPEVVKADIMNTAGQDLFTGASHTGSRYAPNRVGSGRVQADAALTNQAVAYVADDPGAVSVSFGPVAVTGPVHLTKTVKVVNKGLNAATYNIAYEGLTTIPGVSYQISPTTVNLSPRGLATFTVILDIPNAALLEKTIDPTVPSTQGGNPREFLADASGRVVLTPTDGTQPNLRVPVYSAPRPASKMTQAASLTLPAGTIQQANLALTGTGVSQGAAATLVKSIVSGVELQATSGLLPTCSATVLTRCVHFADERAADIKYLGASTDAPQSVAAGGGPLDGYGYFAVTTHGPWRTAAWAEEFDILIDSTGDGVADSVLYNTRLAGLDIFVSELVDLNSGAVLDVEAMNQRLGDIDTALFDSDTMVLPVALAALPGISAHPRIRYGVASFSAESAGPVDLVGMNATGTLVSPMSMDVTRPGVVVSGATSPSTGPPLLYNDQPGTSLVVRRDAPAYGADHAQGVLMVHFHNTAGTKAQVVRLKSASKVAIKLSATSVKYGTAVTATVTIANTAGIPATGAVAINRAPGVQIAIGTAVNGKAVIKLPASLARGTYTVYAKYAGDVNYLAGISGTVTLIVF